MKKIIASFGVAALSSIPTFAYAGPTLTYGFRSISYSQFACIQKAEAKLQQISASNVSRNNNINIFGEFPNTTIGIMCRNNGEVMVTIAGNDAYLLRDEIINHF